LWPHAVSFSQSRVHSPGWQKRSGEKPPRPLGSHGQPATWEAVAWQ
jgi:hypothetical protein